MDPLMRSHDGLRVVGGLNVHFNVAWDSGGLNNVSGSLTSQGGRAGTLFATTSASSFVVHEPRSVAISRLRLVVKVQGFF